MKLFVEVFGAALAISCLEGMNDNGLVTVFGTCTTSDACYTLDTTGVDSTLYDVNNLITFGCDDSDILYDAWVYASSFGLIDESGCDQGSEEKSTFTFPLFSLFPGERLLFSHFSRWHSKTLFSLFHFSQKFRKTLFSFFHFSSKNQKTLFSFFLQKITFLSIVL